MKKYLLSAFAIVALLCVACGGGGDDAPTTVPVSGIKLDKSALSIEIGEKATVTATIAPSDATNKSITWSTANQTIATVSNGVVTGVATGETTLTAKTNDGGYSVTIPVKVVAEKVAITDLGLLCRSEVELGNTTTLFVYFFPKDATNLDFEFEIDNPELIDVTYNATGDGVVEYTLKGLKEGKAKIKAIAEEDGVESNEVSVKVIVPVKVSSIDVAPKDATLAVGETMQFAADIQPEDATKKTLEWSSSNTSVATVTSNGFVATVTAVGKGTATITATAKDGSGVKATAEVEVVGAAPTALTINGKKNGDRIYTWHGKKITLDVAPTPANADITRLYWDLYTSSHTPEGALKYNFGNNKLTVCIEHSTNQSKNDVADVNAWDSEQESTYFGGINVDFKTLGWLFDTRYALELYKAVEIHPFAGIGNDMQKFNWDRSKYPSGVTFVAYYYTDTLADTVSPYSEGKYSYYDYYIPSSEYTLTSSDESKIKVTKNNDGKSWKIERLNTTDLVAVTLTYKCGEHTQTYTINLIP